MIRKILKVFINKYFLTFVAFVVWMTFFDSNNILTRQKFNEKLGDLRQEKNFYREEILRDSTLTQKLLTDSLALEKYAREKYLMKRDNEDVFIVADTSVRR